jgi:hypothetical protein
MKFFSLLIALTTLVTKVAGNSAGTGSCAAGIASVGGTHLNYGPTSSPLRDGGAFTLTDSFVSVSISGVTLTPGTAATFDSGMDLAWTVSSLQAPYKGIFVRVQAGTDNVFTLTGDGTGLSSVALCDALTENVLGVNHNTAAIKTTNSGVMNFVGSGSVSMDVTIVFDNTVSSVYASSNFPLTIGGAPVAPVPTTGTASPAGVPTAPVSPGTSAPAAAPSPTVPTAPTAPVSPGTPAPAPAPTVPTLPTAPTAPTSDECPEGSKKSGKGKGGDSGKGKGSGSGSGKMMMCKGGMMMGMETKTPKSPKTPKAEDDAKGKESDKKGKGSEGKGDARRYLK